MDVMEFFQHSAGQWQSQRTTHHLPFRRAELGGSSITVEPLGKDNEKVIAICNLHEIEPALAVGGAYVAWHGEMAWDRDGEGNHEGTTVFALVPDEDNPRKGRLLRERGYAEIVPVVGRYEMDDEDGLVLETEYDTMSSVERFWFVTPDLRMRSSIVKRFGGFNTASFCAETRLVDGNPVEVSPLDDSEAVAAFEQTSQLAAMGW
ncbi:phycobiliprotein lyase [Leptolyngbya cf. ectocarpi LEGE 11479]|uniref:Chromophore lyase CpcS/CpeS n=1 Tax=Leptolyngbya cf. ectocarpi LEGE 11479 TaxID=1828722 RepID=A0A928ZXE1_LEPEC|nr:phycobiliprotein lyase [Leptolyngbya ectocarpi]MBE9069259.1 phycobiliprotein lyase [Leptolyngbya cf. ectocarpi LEGE 11479]